MSQIVICSTFFEAFGKLPSNAQKEVRSFFDKFSENRFRNGTNYEKINMVEGKQLSSARLNDRCRVILHEDQKEKKIYVLWVDYQHDDAYDWAKNKTKLDLTTATITLMDTNEYFRRGLHTATSTNLFSGISSRDLKAIGVKLTDIEIVRSIPDMKTLETYKDYFEKNVFDNLEWLANDLHIRDLLEYNKQQRNAILDYINEKVFTPAINHPDLDEDIKESVRNTFERLKKKETTKEILDFFNDALDARRGKTIHDAFQKLGLLGFEEIANDVTKLASR